MNKNSGAMSIEQFSRCLKQHDLKITSQRLAVHKAMLELGHACADMVSEEIGRSGGTKVTVATVYNILSQMSLLGIYHHRLSNDNKMYFDVNVDNHIHLYDTKNHTFSDLRDEELFKAIEDKLSRRKFKGFKIDGIDIQILCHPTSRKRKAAKTQ